MKLAILIEYDAYGTVGASKIEETLNETNYKNYIESRLIIKKLAEEKDVDVPSFIQESRTVNEAVDSIIQDAEHNYVSDSAIKGYISRSINEFIDYIEEKNVDVQILHVKANVPVELTYQNILDSIEKCEYRINTGDYSGAVTSAKTLVEGVCKEILENFPDVEVPNNIKLPALFNLVRENLSLNPGNPNLNQSLKQVLSGLISVVSGITEVRNYYGDSHLSENILKEHHALVVVNAAKTLVNFLFGTYSYQLNKGKLEVR
ncbi:abortive infection family protein [Oceanobacillus locisalsi]|uniref:Abortive infection family protein n=1 Tax=Oceanobacillus locisalsi TaxID=546107 RepID=A0ABW3NAE0_9BACI